MSNTIKSRVLLKTDITANWEKATNFIPKAGEVCIYSDRFQLDDGTYVPGIKVGDGTSYISELEFMGDEYISNEDIDTILGTMGSGAVSSELLRSLLDGSITEFSDEEITSLKDYCFYRCQSLASINCPNVTSIGKYAFCNCSRLIDIVLGEITQLGDYAFQYCYYFDETLHTFDFSFFSNALSANGAFQGSGLKQFNWYPSISIIEINGNSVFQNSELRTIKIEKELTGLNFIGEDIFSNTPLSEHEFDNAGIIVPTNSYQTLMASTAFDDKYKYLFKPEIRKNSKYDVFYIDNVPYSCLVNTTFETWINSIYTFSKNFEVSNVGFIKRPEDNYTLTSSTGGIIYSTDTIVKGAHYNFTEASDNEPT